MNQLFSVEIIISNKPQARDPEGETIIRDLVHKTGYESVKEIRTGKLLTIQIDASSQEDARDRALLMCNDLRLYNPVAHSVSVRVRS